MPRKIVILGAAGRDFHNFNVVYRGREEYRVVAFTATQIPNIEGRTYPAELAGPGYPDGIPILPEDQLEQIVREHTVDEVVFSYSDLSHEQVMHLASRAVAAGADFRLLGLRSTALRSNCPVVAVCAVRTGVGKSQTTRRVVALLSEMGVKVVVVRHPMPYGDLAAQAVQRFASVEDLFIHRCTIEEWEEYHPHLERGSVVYAGIDYEAILRQAEQEADVIVWDGGNNDLPFYAPDLHLVLADPHRPGHETRYYPGEANLRAAGVVVINKVDSAEPSAVEAVRQAVQRANPEATVLEADSPITVEGPEVLRGRRVLVVEDGPTLTHGEMPYGAGTLAARREGAAELIDPRPFAVGSLQGVYRSYPHMGPLLPAMGYGEVQRRELEETIRAARPEAVVIGTPIDLARVVPIDVPAVRVRYELAERPPGALKDLLRGVLPSSHR